MPKLNITGLGLSTLVTAEGKTQEELDVNKLVLEGKHQTVQQPVVQSSLPDNPWGGPKKPFAVPSLKIGGLGMSTLVKEDGKTQEEQDVDKLVNEQKQVKQ